MQMKNKLVDEKASMAIYVFIVLFSFLIILSTLYFSMVSIRKAQLITIIKIKQSYERNNENIEEIYQAQLDKKSAKVNVGEITDENGTINGEDANWNNPIVPEGYKPINTETSNWGDGSSNPTEENVNKGLVIEDGNNNQWVWVPVKDVNVMCDLANGTEYTLCGTSGDTAVKTKLYSKSGIISGQTRTTPGTTVSRSYREPDLVVGIGGTSYDATNYKIILGENGTKEQLAQLFVDEYKDMIESVRTYGGFYIGRYELTANGEKPGPTLTNTNWYNLYNKCKEFEASDKVKSRMIWGCQWDITSKWLSETEFASDPSKVYSNSSSWGNYKDSTENAKVVVDGENKYGTKQDTGFSEYWKANNIYDFAGNCWEWSQEADSTLGRAGRGGDYCSSGSFGPASNRSSDLPTSDNSSIKRFSSHFNSSRGF